jgi:hypothetical protein
MQCAVSFFCERPRKLRVRLFKRSEGSANGLHSEPGWCHNFQLSAPPQRSRRLCGELSCTGQIHRKDAENAEETQRDFQTRTLLARGFVFLPPTSW